MIKHLLQLTTTWQQWLAVDLMGSFHQNCSNNRFKNKKKHNKIDFNQCEFFYIRKKIKTSVTYKALQTFFFFCTKYTLHFSLQNVMSVNHPWMKPFTGSNRVFCHRQEVYSYKYTAFKYVSTYECCSTCSVGRSESSYTIYIKILIF